MQLNELLAQIDALKAEIDQLRPLKPEVEHRIMQKFRLDWNYHSNAIEGNTLTLGETKAFLMEGLTASGKPLKDHLDIKGHNELIDFLQLFIQRQERLTEAAIREMHKILLREPYEAEAVTLDGRIVKKLIRLGEYKTTPNFVRTGSGQIHQYATPEDVAPKMAELVEWQREQEQKAEFHPVVHAALFHHRFLAIHPFDDGNGRLGRILMNLLVMRAGFPPAVVKLSERDQYITALRQADAGEVTGLMEFLAQCIETSETLYLKGANGESVEDYDDVDKRVELLKRQLASVPVPLDLNLDTQRDHLNGQLIPFLTRLAVKLRQFDELFAASQTTLIHNTRGEDGNTSGNQGYEGDLNSIVEMLTQFTESRRQLVGLEIDFRWDGFLKNGGNDFGAGTGFSLEYHERKFRFESRNPQMSKTLLYGSWFSDDSIRQLVSDFTKSVLEQIERNRNANRTD